MSSTHTHTTTAKLPRREAWLTYMGIGGFVCAEPAPGHPDGICGMPTESEPCTIHHPPTEAVAPR